MPPTRQNQMHKDIGVEIYYYLYEKKKHKNMLYY